MKKLVLLFAALLVAGCGEKSSPEGSDSAGASAEPSADAAEQVPTESPGKEPSVTLPLSDADVERLLKEAVESLTVRDGLLSLNDEPYSGWVKAMHDSGQVDMLAKAKDGKLDGLYTFWHENGQKWSEGTYKDGKLDGLVTNWHENGEKTEGTYKDGNPHGSSTSWHENGQKAMEATWKDGELISAKYWNSNGEEVETVEEAQEYPHPAQIREDWVTSASS